MLSFLRSLLGHRYREPETPAVDPPCDECEQLEVRRRLHEVADRLQALQVEASLYERRRERRTDDDPRHRY